MNDTTTSNCNPATLNYKTLKEATELIKNFKDPIFEWMKSKGYDPDKGGRLIISTEMADIFIGRVQPFYIVINDNCVTNNPFLINTFAHLLDVEKFKPFYIGENNAGKENKK